MTIEEYKTKLAEVDQRIHEAQRNLWAIEDERRALNNEFDKSVNEMVTEKYGIAPGDKVLVKKTLTSFSGKVTVESKEAYYDGLVRSGNIYRLALTKTKKDSSKSLNRWSLWDCPYIDNTNYTLSDMWTIEKID